jgi:hypothetical protein
MNKSDFVKNFLKFSKDEGFSFLSPDQHFDDPQKLPGGRQAIMAGIIGAGMSAVLGGGAITGGLFGAGVGYQDKKKDEVIADLRRISEHCDLVGIKLNDGAAVVRLLIDAEDVSGEALVGRCAMIHQRGADFQKYSMVIMKNWLFGDTTVGTYIQVVLMYGTHRNAKYFIQNCAESCKHTKKQLYTYPWVIDLEDEELTRIQPKILALKTFFGKKTEEYKAGFFAK